MTASLPSSGPKGPLRPRLALAILLAALTSTGCGGSASSAPGASADAAAPVDGAADSPAPDQASPSLPPSPDCRYIDDSTTCVGTFVLPGTYLYVCGELTATDGFDGGAERPFPPPLPPSFDCRNVAPPVPPDAGPSELGALWCCNAPPACVRALALDVTCAQGLAAFSCPTGGVFPAGTGDGGRCGPAALPDGGLALTPSLGGQEALVCCEAP